MDLQPLKGTADYLPEQQILRARIVRTLVDAFERYGYSPAETPVLHHFEVLSSKYSGGAEILKETYHLTDQGGRELGLRYDLTVPFARLVGKEGRELPLPFKRYEIGRVFRNGPVKTGRLREFTQCDVDCVGSRSMAVEAEQIAMAFEVFDALGMKAVCEVNNRKLLSELLEGLGVPAAQVGDAILCIDKLKKIGWQAVGADLESKGIPSAVVAAIQDRFSFYDKAFGSDARRNRALIEKLNTEGVVRDVPSVVRGEQGIDEIHTVFRHLDVLGVATERVRFMPSLARGLEIYTGAVFEFFLPDSPISSSIAAGGRYDKIVGAFIANAKSEGEEADVKDDLASAYPACGISFGLDVIMQALIAARPEEAERRTVARVCIVPMGAVGPSLQLAAKLRKAGVATEVLGDAPKVKKAMGFIDKVKIPYAIVYGENEATSGAFKVKRMSTGEERAFSSAEDAAAFLKDAE